MKYTMTNGRDTIELDTETGIISGKTYPMRDAIKNDLYATWDAAAKVWRSDKLAETVEEYKDYLTRLYKLAAMTAKTVSSRELVNGNDGFYELIHYTDGTTAKHFVG